MAKFPSVAWFDAVRNVFNSDDKYQGAGGGKCDCILGVKVGKDEFLVTFEGFEVVQAEKTKNLGAADFFLEMAPADWKEMLKDIAANDGATLHYTLNTLDLDREEGLSHSLHGDQYREDLFFRYNQTIQFFFDASARVKTTY